MVTAPLFALCCQGVIVWYSCDNIVVCLYICCIMVLLRYCWTLRYLMPSVTDMGMKEVLEKTGVTDV